mgnify:CR=1 FL=1
MTALGALIPSIGVGLLLASELLAMAGSPLGTLCMLGAAATWALGAVLSGPLHSGRMRVGRGSCPTTACRSTTPGS